MVYGTKGAISGGVYEDINSLGAKSGSETELVLGKTRPPLKEGEQVPV